MTAIPPTHMLAVFRKQLSSKSESCQPRKVTLYPVHSLVFASHCASFPKIPSPLPSTLPEDVSSIRKVDVPVWPLCLPSPATPPPFNTGIRTEGNFALSLLGEYTENMSVPLKTSAFMGLALAYAGSHREDLLA
jgi:hypothetical protein